MDNEQILEEIIRSHSNFHWIGNHIKARRNTYVTEREGGHGYLLLTGDQWQWSDSFFAGDGISQLFCLFSVISSMSVGVG